MLQMNQVELVGVLMDPPLVQKLPDGTRVIHYTLGVGRAYKNSDGSYSCDAIPCVSYGALAERIANKLQKGMSLGIVGEIRTRQSADHEGEAPDNSVEIIAKGISYMEAKNVSDDGR